MKRLTRREFTLFLILIAILLASGYYLWFYLPTSDTLSSLTAQTEEMWDRIELDQLKLVREKQMEEELEALFAADPDPVGMAAYDNSRDLMVELNGILSAADSYSLDFETVNGETEDGIIRRSLSLQFDARGYEAAKKILTELHDGPYRCMFLDLNIRTAGGASAGSSGLWWVDSDEGSASSGSRTETGSVSVSATLVFFEYRED